MPDIEECTVAQARDWHEEGQTLFVDIRDPQSYSKGHIAGARPLDNDSIEEFIKKTPKDSRVVICCYHGNSSQGACEFLRGQGFNHAYSLKGGFAAWAGAGPTESS